MLYKTRFKSWRKGEIRRSATGIVYYYNCNNLSRKVQTLCKASAIIFHNNLYLYKLFFIHWFFTRIKFPMGYASCSLILCRTNENSLYSLVSSTNNIYCLINLLSSSAFSLFRRRRENYNLSLIHISEPTRPY